MKAWIQRVARASVTIDGECVSRIDRGYLVLLGVTQTDTDAEADRIAERIPVLRLFTDERGLMNLSLEDVGGSVIVVSQFTLYADTAVDALASQMRHARNRPIHFMSGWLRNYGNASVRSGWGQDALGRIWPSNS